MRNYFFRIKFRLLFLLLLFAGSGIHAQVYPVQVTVVPTPPHRNYLNSFSEQGALNVFLTLTDFNSGPISVKLKMELNGPGYQFRSLPNNLVYVLNPGQPVQVPMEDLAVFFSSTGQTLNFNPAKLPEGNTSICIDVIKNQSGEVLSQNGCGYFYMGYGQPASLLQPACNATVQIPAGYPASTDLRTLPLQFNFIPALAPIGLQQEVENTLYIYNWLGTVNTNPPLTPNGLALAMDPVELGPITAHTLLPINNQLIVGQEYVWYVKTSLNGSTNQFQNGGWSAPCKFKYGAAQSVEEALANGLSVEWVDLVSNSESKGTGIWKVVKEDPNSSATFNQFILKYRRKVPAGQQPFEWFSDTVNDLSKAIYQLEPATTYEASVAGRLGSFVSEPTEIRTFTTAPPRTYSCGVANFPGRATAFQPLEYADPGMKVKIGMFQLEFVSVQNTGQPGHFSGTGLIPVDFLFGAEARVKFDNLKIDKEYDVWEGTAHVITDGLDAWLEDQYQQFQDPIFVNGTVDSAYVSDSIAHVIIDGVDTTFTFPCATCPVIINDVAGNQVTIYPNGTVIWNSYLDVSDEQLDVPDSEIGVFEQHAQETGGFDPFEHIEWNANYEIIRTSNAVNYFVANKSVIKGQPDKVSLSVPENKYTATNVKLSWTGLTTPLAPFSSTVSSGKRVFVFDLPAFNNDDEFAIYAVSDNLKIGKLNVVVYEELEKNVVIVPLAGTIDAAQLTTQLNETLGEAGLNFTVTISDTLGVGKYAANSALNIPDATLMSKYSGKMRQIRNNYFDKHDSENDTYYLFVVSSLMDTVNNQSVDGYMVRGKSVGFVQTGTSLHTLAHELGHGIGALGHSWKNNGPEQEGTNNLMDYSNGENLILAQWTELRNPKGNSFWDEEEDFFAGGSLPEKDSDSEENNENELDETVLFVHDFPGSENWVYKSSNGFFFKFSTADYEKVSSLFINKSGHVKALFTIDETYFQLGISMVDKQGNSSNHGLYFFNPDDTTGYVTRVYPNGTTHTIIPTDPNGINILSSNVLKCNQVTSVVIGFDSENNKVIKSNPVCPDPEDEPDCNWTQQFFLDNPGSCAWRINRSSVSCIKTIPVSKKQALADVLADKINDMSEISNLAAYEKINSSELGVEAPEWFPGIFNDGGAYDMGLAFVKLMEGSIHQPEMRTYLKNILTKNNSELLRKFLVDWDFYNVTFQLAQLSGGLNSGPISSTRNKEVSVFGKTFTRSGLVYPYVIGGGSVECKEFACTYSGGEGRMIFLENGTIQSTVQFTESFRFFVSKADFKANGGSTALLFGNPTYNISNGQLQQNIPLNGIPALFSINGKSYVGTEYNDFVIFGVPSDYSFTDEPFDPFEPLAFVFDENHNPLGIEEGKVYIMPAVWGLCMEKAIKDYKDEIEDRIITDKLISMGGIILAPFTGGASLGLTLLSVGVAEYDLAYLETQQDQTLQEYQDDESFRNAWNTVYVTVQIVDGLVSAPALLNSIGDFYTMVRQSKFLEASKQFVKEGYFNLLRRVLGSKDAVKKIETIEELKVFLGDINETTTMLEIHEKGIESLFRGTTRSKTDNSLFPGNPNSQSFGISTSTDPIKATIFAIEGATSNGSYKGVLQMGLTGGDLKNIALTAPNYRVAKELEVILNTPAANFSNLAQIEISVDNARKLVKEVYGIDLPATISRSYSDELLETITESSLEKAFEFYQKAVIYNIK
jgi:hypothetical protein